MSSKPNPSRETVPLTYDVKITSVANVLPTTRAGTLEDGQPEQPEGEVS